MSTSLRPNPFLPEDPGGPPVTGWDIGGANLKAARLSAGGLNVRTRPFAIWQRRDELAHALRALAFASGLGGSAQDRVAVTITAELSDAFRSKREGIAFVLDALAEVYPHAPLAVFGVDGRFHSAEAARADHMRVAAANWMATALLVARRIPECLLVDIGSTTTDIVPIVGGAVAAQGRNDPERLLRGELCYSGALRTTVAAVVRRVPLWGGWCPVSAEHFASVQDAHLLLGSLAPEECVAPSADGRPAEPEFAAERLARVVCADTELLHPDEILAIARHIADTQVRQIAGAITQVLSAQRPGGPLVATGVGSFLAEAAASQLGLPCEHLAERLGKATADAAPAAAVAILLQADKA
jgi:(4-(4-[2-(gamma-L-glutamylamino)ethyl]phenoxymethyl)furan-2-yl)methanamine synthase